MYSKALQYIGQTGLAEFRKQGSLPIFFKVVVKDYKEVYGRPRFLISPHTSESGSGEMWIQDIHFDTESLNVQKAGS